MNLSYFNTKRRFCEVPVFNTLDRNEKALRGTLNKVDFSLRVGVWSNGYELRSPAPCKHNLGDSSKEQRCV